VKVLRLEAKRLLLRSFQDSDLDPFVAYRSDPTVARYQSWDTPYTPAQARAFIDEMKRKQPATQGEWYQLAIELKDTSALIGDCAFHVLSDATDQAEIGFTLAQQHQGCGYATEAVARLLAYLFGEIGLRRVTATCDVENASSIRLLERLGLRREGHFVENLWFKGQWGSEYSYALLQRDWQTASEQSKQPDI
jgi:RimJ/RimL family protein N-acetyltransferase